jgi:hypothetical protein
MARVVHVIRGASAAASFEQAGMPANEHLVLTLHDCLSYGPLRPITEIRSWIAGRKAYWEGLAIAAADGTDTLYSDLFEFEPNDEIVIWLGTNLADQIALVWLPAFLQAAGVQVRALDAVQFDRNPRGLEVSGLGMLTPAQIAAHPPPATLTDDQLAVLNAVWRTLTATEPSGLPQCIDAAEARHPFLARALREGLLRFPDAARGLNAWEARIVRQVGKVGPRAAHVIGEVLLEAYEQLRAGIGGRDIVGDLWLFDRMVRLADPKLPEPLFDMKGSRVEYRDTEVRLTSFGQRVLDGQANFVDENGIDDWVFGVHLQSEAGRVWFHRDGELIRR